MLQFMDPSIDTAPIAPALAEYFDDVLGQSVSKLNFGVRLSSSVTTVISVPCCEARAC